MIRSVTEQVAFIEEVAPAPYAPSGDNASGMYVVREEEDKTYFFIVSDSHNADVRDYVMLYTVNHADPSDIQLVEYKGWDSQKNAYPNMLVTDLESIPAFFPSADCGNGDVLFCGELWIMQSGSFYPKDYLSNFFLPQLSGLQVRVFSDGWDFDVGSGISGYTFDIDSIYNGTMTGNFLTRSTADCHELGGIEPVMGEGVDHACDQAEKNQGLYNIEGTAFHCEEDACVFGYSNRDRQIYHTYESELNVISFNKTNFSYSYDIDKSWTVKHYVYNRDHLTHKAVDVGGDDNDFNRVNSELVFNKEIENKLTLYRIQCFEDTEVYSRLQKLGYVEDNTFVSDPFELYRTTENTKFESVIFYNSSQDLLFGYDGDTGDEQPGVPIFTHLKVAELPTQAPIETETTIDTVTETTTETGTGMDSTKVTGGVDGGSNTGGASSSSD